MSKDGKLGKCVCFDRQKLLSEPVRIKLFRPTSLAATIKDSADGKPLAGIEVAAVLFQGNSSSWSARQTTNAAGRIVFQSIYSGGMYRLEVDATGYNSFRTPWPPPAVGSKGWKPVQEVKLKKADMGKGRVVDEQGKPVAGASVELIAWESSATTSDANGSFEIGVPPEDRLEYDERLHKPMVMFKVVDNGRDIGAFANINRAELLANGITITARPGHTLTIVVKDTDGKPLKGAEVEAFAWFGGQGEGSRILFTDAGETVVPSVYYGGNYCVQAKLKGYYSPDVHLPDPMGSDKWKDRVEVVMERADRVQCGIVVDEGGAQVAGAIVKSYVSDDSRVTTGYGGAFTLTGLPASKVTLTASFGDLRGSADVSKASGDVVIKLKKPKTK